MNQKIDIVFWVVALQQIVAVVGTVNFDADDVNKLIASFDGTEITKLNERHHDLDKERAQDRDISKLKTKIEDLEKLVKEGKWPAGGYCIWKHGSCPPGFRLRFGRVWINSW